MFKPWGWMSLLVFVICQNLKEVDNRASEGMDMLARQEQAHKEQKLPSIVNQKNAQIRGGSSHLKTSGLKVCFPTSKIWIRNGSLHLKLNKNYSQVFPYILGFELIPDVKLTSNGSHHNECEYNCQWMCTRRPEDTYFGFLYHFLTYWLDVISS